jgi:2-dehydro-3-deoxyglucarate aldolase/4-hydroxy-2-oxoheptanedioate aldolase
LSSLRSRALGGETLLGCFLTWPTAGVAELLSLAGFDFLVIDSEHGFFSIESIEAMVTAADGAGLPSIVRVPSCIAAEVGRSLDAGAAGILFPRADGRAAARGAIESAKYPPDGKRGLGGARANRYGTVPLDRFVKDANEKTAIVVQIETPGALSELREIASEPLLDVLYVGPNDLTQALGVPGHYSDPRYREALARIAAQAKSSGKAAGIMLGRADQIPALRDLGYTFFTTSDRTLVLESARAWRAALKP